MKRTLLGLVTSLERHEIDNIFLGEARNIVDNLDKNSASLHKAIFLIKTYVASNLKDPVIDELRAIINLIEGD